MKNREHSTNKTLTYSLRIMEIVLQSLVFVSFAVMIMLAGIGLPDRDLWKCFLMIIPVIATYLIRRFIRKFQLNIFLYIVIVASSLLFGTNDSEYFFYALILLVIVSYSFRQKMLMLQKADISSMPLSDIMGTMEMDNADERNRILYANEQISYYFGVSMVVGYLIGGIVNRPVIQNTEVVLFVVFVLLQVVYNNLKSLNTVFLQNAGKSEFPSDQIKRVNTFIIITLVILMFIGMMVFYHGEYGNIFGVIGAGFLAVLKVIIRVILKIWGSGKGQQGTMEEETTAAMDDDLSGVADSVGTSPLMQAIGIVFTIIVFVIVLFAIGYLIVQFIRNFNKVRQDNKDIIEYVKPNKTKSDRQVKRKDDNIKTLNNNLKFRKHYKKRVIKGYGSNRPEKTVMPHELTMKAITKEPTEAEKITQLYEKARYSNESLTNEEVDLIKKHS